jgi:multidrug efflux pump subunit AcrA (membrane-fusion protein)
VTTSATGQISSGVYNLNFFTSGKVAEIDVTAGQNVSAGQVLAKLDTTTLLDALNSAQAGLNSAQVSLNNAYTSRTNSDAIANDNYQKALANAKTTADQQAALDQYNQSLAQAQAQVDSAVSQYHNAQNQLTTAQHNFANATLTAPVAGQIAAVNGQVGVAPGSGSSAFIVLVNLSDLTITAPVNEADIGAIQPGQPVSFTVQAFPADTFAGTVATISPVGTTTQNVVTYPVTVNIDPKSAQQERLFPGMTAQLTITTKQVIDALLVPNTALAYARTAVRSGRVATAQVQQALAQAQQLITNATDDAVKQGSPSYILEQQNGKVVAVPVVTGITDGANTVILSGLNENDPVLTGDNKTTTTTPASSTQRTRGGAGGGLFGGGR